MSTFTDLDENPPVHGLSDVKAVGFVGGVHLMATGPGNLAKVVAGSAAPSPVACRSLIGTSNAEPNRLPVARGDRVCLRTNLGRIVLLDPPPDRPPTLPQAWASRAWRSEHCSAPPRWGCRGWLPGATRVRGRLSDFVHRDATADPKSSKWLSEAYDGAPAVAQGFATLKKPQNEVISFRSVDCVIYNSPTESGDESVHVLSCQRTGAALTVQIRDLNGDLTHDPRQAAGLVEEAWSALA